MDDNLQAAFQEELESLDQFRLTYAALYPGVPLERADPDVRRMIEALALFSARTRLAAQRSMAATSQRLFAQHFAPLLSPLPAMSMMRADLNARLTEPARLPRGSRLSLTQVVEELPGRPQERAYEFRTLAPLALWPLRLTRLDTIKRYRAGPVILLELTYNHAFVKPIDTLRFHLNHLDELLSSLEIFHNLRRHLQSVQLFVGRKPQPQDAGKVCDFHFGALEIPTAEHTTIDHTLELARRQIALPEQGLYLHVDVDLEEGRYRRFYLRLELADGWPERLSLVREMFQLGVVPIENVTEADAMPVECDGTRDRYRIDHPDGARGFRLHRLIGAMRFSDDGLQPLRPGIFGMDGESYELEQSQAGAFAYLRLNLPDAFETPVQVTARASWYQPAVDGLRASGLTVVPRDRHIDGVSWQLTGTLSKALVVPSLYHPDTLLQLVALRTRRFLEAPDLRFLLRALGAEQTPHYAGVVGAIRNISYRRAPSGRSASATGFRYDITLTLGPLDGIGERFLSLFERYMKYILRSWSSEEIREMTIVRETTPAAAVR